MIKRILSFTLILTVALSLTCMPFSAAEISQERADEVISFFNEYTELYEDATADDSIPYPYLLPAEKYRDREEYEALGKKYLTGNMLNGYLNNMQIIGFNGQVGVLDLNVLEMTPQISWTFDGDPTTDWDDLTPIKEIRDGNIIYRAIAVNNIEKNPFKPANYMVSDVWKYVEEVEDWCLASSFYWFPRLSEGFTSEYGDWGSRLMSVIKESLPEFSIEEPPYETYPLCEDVEQIIGTLYSALHINNLYSDPSLYFNDPYIWDTEYLEYPYSDDYLYGTILPLKKFDMLTSALSDVFSNELVEEYLKKDSFTEDSEGYVVVNGTEKRGPVFDFTDDNLTVDIIYNENNVVKVELGMPQYDENGKFTSTEKALVILEKKNYNVNRGQCQYTVVYEEFSGLTGTYIPNTADRNTEVYVLLSIAAVVMGMWITIRSLRKKA